MRLKCNYRLNHLDLQFSSEINSLSPVLTVGVNLNALHKRLMYLWRCYETFVYQKGASKVFLPLDGCQPGLFRCEIEHGE